MRDAIREQLMESRPAPTFRPSPAAQPGALLPYSEMTQALENMAPENELEPSEHAPIFHLQPQRGPDPRLDFYDAPPLDLPVATPHQEEELSALRLPIPDTHGAFPAGTYHDGAATLTDIGDLRPLGQLHDSFIIAAGRDGLWIIDQHVAHERILFEKVLSARSAGRVEVQRFTDAADSATHSGTADRIRAHCGRNSSPTASSPNRSAIGPSRFRPLRRRLVRRIWSVSFTRFWRSPNRKRAMFRSMTCARAIAASIACRAAIKINTRLDPPEDGLSAARTVTLRFPDGLPARTPGRAAVLDQGDFESIPPDLTLG